jgi:hypothetical protein
MHFVKVMLRLNFPESIVRYHGLIVDDLVGRKRGQILPAVTRRTIRSRVPDNNNYGHKKIFIA